MNKTSKNTIALSELTGEILKVNKLTKEVKPVGKIECRGTMYHVLFFNGFLDYHREIFDTFNEASLYAQGIAMDYIEALESGLDRLSFYRGLMPYDKSNLYHDEVMLLNSYGEEIEIIRKPVAFLLELKKLYI